MKSAKEQSEILLGELLEFAKKMLRTHGEFHPFGGYLTESEEVVHVGLSPDVVWAGARQRAEALSESLRSLAERKQPLVFGIVTNVSLPNEGGNGDAIRVFLEHRSGYCADVFFHYTLAGELTITDIAAQRGSPHLFQSMQ